MAQLFPRRANTLARLSILGVVGGIAGLAAVVYAVWWSPYMTEVAVPQDQPVQFSHQHHVAGLGIDCRYCHTAAEKSASAGLPPTHTCMTCHSQVWTEAPVLVPVRESMITGRPLAWNRVHDLPDFVFFNHSIHVNKGIGCTTCHGPVDRMPLIHKTQTLYMKWCLDCHRHPERFLRPPGEVFSSTWQPPPDQIPRGLEMIRKQNIRSATQLSDCSICHR